MQRSAEALYELIAYLVKEPATAQAKAQIIIALVLVQT